MEGTAVARGDFHERSPDERVQDAARGFHLAVTTEQLLDAGLSKKAIAHRVERGWLARMHRGVYRVGPVESRWTREAGALLACGDAAALSHASAGAVSGMRAWVNGPVDVTIGRGKRAGHEGIRIHHAPLTRGEVTVRDGLRITTPERTLLDLAVTLAPEDLDRTVNEAQARGLTTAEALLSYLARTPRRAGVKALEAALRHEPRPTQSELQRRMLALVVRVGLPLPQTEVDVVGYTVDFLWPAQRLIVETDGHAAHGTGRRFETDRARDAHLTACGYRVLRFTWRQLTREPEVVAARLAAALAHPAAAA
jgi:very-short-patch-repair endonuclease